MTPEERITKALEFIADNDGVCTADEILNEVIKILSDDEYDLYTNLMIYKDF